MVYVHIIKHNIVEFNRLSTVIWTMIVLVQVHSSS